MAVYRTYRCPDCEKCFDFLHHPNDEPPPDFCPLCGSNVSGKETRKKRVKQVDRVNSPNKSAFIRSGGRSVAKSVDGVYRGMENASNQRAQEAADLLGVDVRTLSNMKMTNMKDNLREGDMSYIPSEAAKIQGTLVDSIRADTGRPLGATFGMQGAAPGGGTPLAPGKPSPELTQAMASTFANHRNRVQATVAAGRKS